MSQRNHIDGYVSLEQRIPTANEVLAKICGNRVGHTTIDILELNQRTCIWLERAAYAAWATLNLLYEYCPERNRTLLAETADELHAVIRGGRENYPRLVGPEANLAELKSHIENLQQAVAHGGNILNNSVPLWLPEEMLKPALDVRDLCDEAIRQPTTF